MKIFGSGFIEGLSENVDVVNSVGYYSAVTAKDLAIASAASAVSAKNQAVAAWTASTSPSEQLAPNIADVHSGNVVKSMIYDTSRDTDQGAWIKRCTHTSWYNEELGGDIWLGRHATAVAAWAAGNTYGPEMVTNGNFDTDLSSWFGVNWVSLGGGQAYPAGTQPLTQTIAGLEIGSTYKCEINITKCDGSYITITLGDSVNEVQISTSGLHTIYFTPISTAGPLRILPTNGNATAFFTIDSISVKKRTSLPGNYFQNTTDGKFYKLGASAPAVTEVFRGNVREFPSVSLIVGDTVKTVIYDLTQPGNPMWLSFGAFPCVTADAINGLVFTGYNGAGIELDFIRDRVKLRRTLGAAKYGPYLISQRNNISITATVTGVTSADDAIVSNNVADVAITALENSPINPATGLPFPTIAIATDAGVSVVKDNGTTVSITGSDALNATGQISLNGDELSFTSLPTNGHASYGSNKIPASNFSAAGIYFFFRKRYYYTSGVVSPSILGIPYTVGYLQTKRKYTALGSSTGLTILHENPSLPTSSMVNYVTPTHTSGWQVGDIRSAQMADTVVETITTSSELVTNGTFVTDTSGWAATAATISIVSGKLRITATAASPNAYQSFATTIGKTYKVSLNFATAVAAKNTFVYVGTGIANAANLNANLVSTPGIYSFDFVATNVTTFITLSGSSLFVAADFIEFDDISIKIAEADRSVKNNGLIINGVLSKALVATSGNLVGYSGFTAANYLEQPYNTNLDFGAGDFSIMGWVKFAAGASTYSIISRSSAAAVGWSIWRDTSSGSSNIRFLLGASGSIIASGSSSLNDSAIHHVCISRASGVVSVWVDGKLDNTPVAYASSLDAVTPTTLYGKQSGVSAIQMMALWRISATAPSADQIARIYRTEFELFQPNAQCTIVGSSPSVSAIAYDDITNMLHVGTTWGRSSFSGLIRVESEAVTTGTVSNLSSHNGAIVTSGSSGTKVYSPAVKIREELRRKELTRLALGKTPVFFDYTATASQTTFVAPKGYTIKALYKNGTLMRETTTGVYWSRSNDGFQETATLSVGASVSDWISLMCVRT